MHQMLGKVLIAKKNTIIFLHGSGLSHIVWSLAEQFFSNKNFNVLSLDLPGHGNSEGPCLRLQLKKLLIG